MYPALHQINTRVMLAELGGELGRRATLDDLSDDLLDGFVVSGFDFIWLMGVWQTGEAGRNVSRTNAEWRAGYRADLPDFQERDVVGSPFAVKAYSVHTDFGGNEALIRLRERMLQRGLRLILDFVPNHTALDHAWVSEHPEYYIEGTEADLKREPRNYLRIAGAGGMRILAYGRDPYFSGWVDTFQLNYRHAGLRAAMIGELLKIAELCDGVRCDMAMLVLSNVFSRTWGERSLPRDGGAPAETPFWPEAIGKVRAKSENFVFLSEVYWDLEAALQAQGFDYTYDKSYYDRLRHGEATPVREHLKADLEFQNRSARFLENHDEVRAATAFVAEKYQAAAVLTYTVPGMRFFQDGQFEGRRKHPNIHLGRRAEESPDPLMRDFYGRLLPVLRKPELREGAWRLLEQTPAWAENPTWQNYIAYEWRGGDRQQMWVVVNFGATAGQCYVHFDDDSLRGVPFLLRDQMSRAWYQRDGSELADKGLYVDLPAWGYYVFDVVAT